MVCVPTLQVLANGINIPIAKALITFSESLGYSRVKKVILIILVLFTNFLKLSLFFRKQKGANDN
jgi:hypothetical protein